MLRNILATSLLTNSRNVIPKTQFSALTLEYEFIPPKINMMNIMEDRFQYLGLIKNLPHYLKREID